MSSERFNRSIRMATSESSGWIRERRTTHLRSRLIPNHQPNPSNPSLLRTSTYLQETLYGRERLYALRSVCSQGVSHSMPARYPLSDETSLSVRVAESSHNSPAAVTLSLECAEVLVLDF